MKQLRMHLFWIAVGVLLLIELVLALTMWLDDGPEKSKQALDKQFKSLKGLNERAQNDVKGLYDPENPIDIKKLTNDYLLNEKWKSTLQPALSTYNQQIVDIRKELAARSAELHQKIASGDDQFRWDETYKEMSAALLKRLVDVKGVVVPAGVKPEQLATNRVLRDAVGLYTKDEAVTDRAKHALLTTRLRVMEAIAKVVEEVKVEVVSNPVISGGKISETPNEPAGAAFAGVDWMTEDSSSTDAKKFSGETAAFATAIPLRLTLQGTTAALVAVQARIETLGRPVVSVVGGELRNRGDWKPLDRKDKPYEPMVLKLELVILDCTKAANPEEGVSPVEGGVPEGTATGDKKAEEAGT